MWMSNWSCAQELQMLASSRINNVLHAAATEGGCGRAIAGYWAGLGERGNATTAGCWGVRPDMRPGSVVENESWS